MPYGRPDVSPRALAVLAVLATLATGLLSPPAPASAAEGLAWSIETGDNAHGTDRPNYEFAVDPGDIVEDSVVIVNSGSEPLSLAVYAAEAFTTTSGVLDLRLASEPATDAGAWVSLATTTIELQPGERSEVPFRIDVPVDARPGDHPAGIVTSNVSEQTGDTLNVDRRLGIRIHLRVSGELEPAVEVSDVRVAYETPWNPFAGGTITFSYDLRNTGNTRVAAIDTISATGPFGLGAVPVSPEAAPEVLPGSTIHVERVVTDVAALGWLQGVVVVTPSAVGVGATAMDVVTTDLVLPAMPWTLLIVILVVTIGVIVTLVVVRRRGRSIREPTAP